MGIRGGIDSNRFFHIHRLRRQDPVSLTYGQRNHGQ
jgi:hypothetical protein